VVNGIKKKNNCGIKQKCFVFLFIGNEIPAFGLILGVIAFTGWKLMKNPDTYKIGAIVTYFPFILGVLFILWFALIIATNGGKWN
jgi:hypothetical protein